MIVVPAGCADGLAVDGAVDVTGGGDAGLPVGVNSGTDAAPQPETSRQSTTARLLMRQVWVGYSDLIEILGDWKSRPRNQRLTTDLRTWVLLNIAIVRASGSGIGGLRLVGRSRRAGERTSLVVAGLARAGAILRLAGINPFARSTHSVALGGLAVLVPGIHALVIPNPWRPKCFRKR